jgi:hypothetical protein
MCCALDRPANEYVSYCRDDGLCGSPSTDEIWWESCADPTWQEPKCVKLRVDGGKTCDGP